MRKTIRFFFSAFIIIASVTLSGAYASAQVLINEFMADPARDWDGDGEYSYRNDEWLEIVNAGEVSVDISGLLVSDGTGVPAWRYGFSGSLGPGEVKVVYGSDSRAWEESNGFPVYGLSLNNDGDGIMLFSVTGSDTVMIDSVEFSNSAAEDDRSVGRSATDRSAWEIFDAYNPCSESCDPPGGGCVPTPGQANDCVTALGRSSWGRIKKVLDR